MRVVSAMAAVMVALAGCQPTDEATLIYDVSTERFSIAQWGEFRGHVACPPGFVAGTVPVAKPRRFDTRVSYSSSDRIIVDTDYIGLRKYHRANFYECKEPRKDA